MGIFEFIILITLISTVGKVITERRQPRMPPPPPPDRPALPPRELERMEDAMSELAERVGRLEEERDFYKQLLDSPGRKESLGSGDGSL